MTNADVYPSIDELMPEVLLARIPEALARDIRERYATLGTKYLTEDLHTDGRRINAMMYTSRVANANEEIVDAAFCMLGEIFKANVNQEEIPDWTYQVLLGCIEIYSMLKAVEAENLAKSDGLVNLE